MRRFIVHEIRKQTSLMTHLVRDSKHLVEILSKSIFRARKQFRLMKVDIKDFFMSGKHGPLVNLGGHAIDDDSRSVDDEETSNRFIFKEAIDFVLGSQYIELGSNHGEEGGFFLYQVIEGSGMGLLSSDELSFVLFFVLAEEWS